MLPPSQLGDRLAACRRYLEWAGPEAATPERVAQDTHLPPAVIQRLEQTGEGTAADLATLLSFYVQQDLNLRWVLLPANADLPQVLVDDRWHLPDFTRALRLVRELSQHVQQTALEAMVELSPSLPLDRYTRQELRDYQRDLPPVRAAKAGWQSRVQTLRPFHYYPAGDFLPVCGNVGAALLYDGPPPGRVPAHVKCAVCQRRLVNSTPPASPPA